MAYPKGKHASVMAAPCIIASRVGQEVYRVYKAVDLGSLTALVLHSNI